MHRPLPLLLLIASLAVAGCDGTLTYGQRLAGEWVGRPETASERTVREWPTRAIDPDDPEIAEAAAAAPATDLEAFAGVAVRMKFSESGEAEMSLVGDVPLKGLWSVTPLEGRRGILEIETLADDDGLGAVRRRFEVEFLREGEGFVLREQGADRRFGRLLFQRPGAATVAATKDKPKPTAERDSP